MADVTDDDRAYRDQLAYLFARSPFYREKLPAAGFADAAAAGGLADITALPFTEKDELRATRTAGAPVGAHLAAAAGELVRIYSTSGTTGAPSFIPLTADDLEAWTVISCRSYGCAGAGPGQVLVSTYNAGPFVAGVTLDAFARLGLCHVPVGADSTERLLATVSALRPDYIAMTPSYALHCAERAATAGLDLRAAAVRGILVAGEPGGGEPALRSRIEAAWGARVTEAMGIGDISVSLWGECEHQRGMHFSGTGYVHAELIEPGSGMPLRMEDGAEGELVYTHLRHRAAPLLRFRSRDHVRLEVGPCPCGRQGPRLRCVGRTDDMLILRGVNVFPTALREVVAEFFPAVSGVIAVRPRRRGVSQEPPLPLTVELAEGETGGPGLAEAIAGRVRDRLVARTEVALVPFGSLPRSQYKSKLVDWSAAQ
jgi:phenylacetate-CoA ligase